MSEVSTAGSIEDRYLACQRELESRQQTHVLRWWDSLDLELREHLIRELESIPWPLVDKLLDSHVLDRPDEFIPTDLQPAPIFPRAARVEDRELYDRAEVVGRELLGKGKVAAFTVAGGQGTRLGFDGPKGSVTVTPVQEKTLFQLFAETILAARHRWDATIAWYIMTNPTNHQQTLGFLKDHEFFDLPPEDVVLFCQGMLPAFDFDGKLLMSGKHHLALAPDGHGGSLRAMSASGALEDMKRRRIETVSYFQVDNPLVQPFDELFLGLHRLTGSEMSSKVAKKVDDLERVGNVCLSQGRVIVVEYSNFPDELAHAKNKDGTRTFDVGNLAMHLLDVQFIDRIAGESFELPYHRAEKTVTWMDENGFERTPASPNAVKLETFVFDALPLANNPLLLEIDRSEEFSPVKNATGVDSVDSAIRDQVHRAARWLESAGVKIPYNAEGDPDVTLEIAPSYAFTAADVRRRLNRPPALQPGEKIYIA